MRWRRFALLVPLALVALLAPALSAAQPAPVAERGVSIVVYHAFPDPAAGTARADPFASPVSPPAARLPWTRVDGVLNASDAPQGDPASTSAHFLEMRRLAQERQRVSPDLVLELVARVDAGRLVGRVVPADASLILVEDGLEHDGDSGVRVHRFVARARLAPDADGGFEAPLEAAWDARRVGVVAWVAGPDGSVAQSATWLATQGGPTVQRAHAPLLEHWTATWCAPCGPSDHALALLAAQNGLPLAVESRGYAGAPTPLLLAGLAVGALAGLALVRGRRA